MEKLSKEKDDVIKKSKEMEDLFKTTSRRLSRNYESVSDLNDKIELNGKMFDEASSSSESLPFHGFPSPSKSDNEGLKESNNATLKRFNSSPGTEPSKKRHRHPVIGSKIIVDSVDGSGVYEVRSKKNRSENDYMYCLMKDKKETTLNLKRVTWHNYDAGEKVPMKGTI